MSVFVCLFVWALVGEVNADVAWLQQPVVRATDSGCSAAAADASV
jgi:hypothetical protein